MRVISYSIGSGYMYDENKKEDSIYKFVYEYRVKNLRRIKFMNRFIRGKIYCIGINKYEK